VLVRDAEADEVLPLAVEPASVQLPTVNMARTRRAVSGSQLAEDP